MDRVIEFDSFDTRGYRTVGAREGYGEWAATYESVVEDAMDIALLDRLESIGWDEVGVAADLGCGTGRTGAWLAARGVETIDGVDLTPEMTERARSREVYRRIEVADAASSGFDRESYDVVVTSLVDEHLRDLAPLYSEAGRLLRPGGSYVVVGYHPQFMMVAGMPTHYDAPSGEPVAIETYVHPLSEHFVAATGVGFRLVEFHERLIDDEWIALKPKWERLRHQPIAFAQVWRPIRAGAV
jgi:SAM-dependent methyltransferase